MAKFIVIIFTPYLGQHEKKNSRNYLWLKSWNIMKSDIKTMITLPLERAKKSLSLENLSKVTRRSILKFSGTIS